MFDEHALNTKAKGNLDIFCDVGTFLCLNYIIPLLGRTLSLSKFGVYSSVILLMQLKIVEKICTNCMLI
jgi:hypothetical protein